MTLTDTLAVMAVAISSAGLLVSVISIVIAWGAKRQARQIAVLRPRSEAIDHLHTAVADLRKSHCVNPSTLVNIQTAKNCADLVFNSKLGKDLDGAVETADRLLQQRVKERREPDPGAVKALVRDLQSLITRMNDDAALR